MGFSLAADTTSVSSTVGADIFSLVSVAAAFRVRVHGELIVKPLREADRALDNVSANESFSSCFAIWERFQQLQLAFLRRVSYERDDGCNKF